MKTILHIVFGIGIGACCASAQITTNLDLSTRWIGVPPTHETPSSTPNYMQHPDLLTFEIAVTNFYADTNAALEVDIGDQRQVFYGAGVDQFGDYIPSNFIFSVELELRRSYQVHVSCPNSGGLGSPLYKLTDLDPDSAICTLTNGPCYYSGQAPSLAAFIWSNFTTQDQSLFTNDDPNLDPERQTNLVTEMNRIIATLSLYNSNWFANITLGSDTTNLLAQNPTGVQLVELNRLLLRDALGFMDPQNEQWDYLSGTAQFNFFVQSPPEFTISKTKPADQYSVVLNGNSYGDSSAELTLLQPTDGGYLSTNTSTIEILKGKFAHYGVGDGCDDPRPAPGVGSWLSIGPGVTQATNRIFIDWSVSLGRTFDGLAAGRITLRQEELSQVTYTPYALFYNVASTNLLSEMTVVTTNVAFSFTTNVTFGLMTNGFYGNITNISANTDAVLRQIKAYQTFVDIVASDTNHTVLNFYFPSQVATNQDANGVYTHITGNPFVTWTIENGGPGDTNNLYIIESRNGTPTTQSLVRTVSGGTPTWTLTLGSGAATRVETRQVSFVGTPATDRVESDFIQYSGSSTPAYQCQETYHFYPWGSELAQTSIPNGSAPLVTTYGYDTDTTDPGYGQLEQIVYPDGYWEKRVYWIYDSTTWQLYVPLRIFHPYFDGADGGATSPDNATFENSSVEDVWLPNQAPSPNTPSPLVDPSYPDRAVMTIDHGKFVVNEFSGSDDYGASEGPVKSSYSEKMGAIDIEGWEGFGQHLASYDDTAAPGLSGHTCYSYNDPDRFHYFYYDHGIYDANSEEFVLDPANHFYTWNGLTNNYPDHRQTEIDNSDTFDQWNQTGLLGDLLSELYGLGFVGDADFDAYYAEDQFSLDGHPGTYFGPYDQVGLNTSTRLTSIYHLGNLAQTEMYVYTGAGSGWALLQKLKYDTDTFGRVTNVTRIDAAGSQTRTLYTADYRGTSGVDGELMLSETDETGQTTTYTYDALQRIQSMTVKGHGSQPDRTTTYTYDADWRPLTQTTTAGSLSQSQSTAYDLAGRVTNQVDPSGIAAQTSYSADNQTVTTTYPGGITIVQQQALDRYPTSVQGSGVVAKYYIHGTDGNPVASYSPYGQRQQTTYLGHENSQRWHLQETDLWGNSDAFDERPAGMGTTNTIWTAREYFMNFIQYELTSAGFLPSGYAYDFSDKLIFKETQGPTQDRIAWTKEFYAQLNGNYYLATTNFVFLQDYPNDTPTVSSVHLEQLDGFTGNEIACAIDYDADTNETITTTYLDRANNQITVVTSRPNTSSFSATSVYQNGLPISSSTLSVANPTLYFYDALGRTNQIQSPLGYSTYMTYDPKIGWLTSMTDPAGNTTYYAYYGTNQANAGKLQCQTDPTGKKTYYAYTTQDQLYRTWGDVPYPAQYQYSEYGDLTNLITYRGGSGWTSSSWPSSPGMGDNTYWIYDEASGALLKKIDAQGNATTYAYYPQTDRLFTRSWQRTVGGVQVTVTNLYDTANFNYSDHTYHDDGSGFGDLVAQVYNDGTPAVLINNYSRADLPRQIVDATGTNDLLYDYANRLVSVKGESGGIYAGITVSNHFNPYLGRDILKVTGLSSTLEDDFSYDPYGRLGLVAIGNDSASYGYLPNSDLLQNTTFNNGNGNVMTTTRSWQYGFRLGSIANLVNGKAVTAHAYTYDSVNRRTRATLEDGSQWSYIYNDRNELTGAQRFWSDWSPVTGQQYAYAYDNMGNRQWATLGGDSHGGSLQTISYTANNLDQYTSITTPGCKEIIGLALATNSVTVNGGLADRKVEYFHREISVANTNQPVWQTVSVTSGGMTDPGGAVFPANNQTPVYDADGNLSFDCIWTYQWDGENRLKTMTMTNAIGGIVNSNILQLRFGYDYMGRRVSKIVSAWNGSTFVAQSTNYFVFDGWNLIAAFNPQSSVLQSFTWGDDLSGTMDQAGGVGGLLIATISGTNCFAAYDGNGNISALISSADNSAVARYEYSPYGELIRATGSLARQNSLRFSTKFFDEESGLIYYGARYYSSFLGRWINKDPSWEKDNRNLYGFVHNAPIITIDRNGKDSVFETILGWNQDYGDMAVGLVTSYLNEDEFSDVLTDTVGGFVTDKIADITINPAIILDDIGRDEMASEIQEGLFMQNAQKIIVSKINSKIANDTLAGLAVGIAALQVNASGGNGDDLVLDAALAAAGTSGVDASETIWSVATDLEY